MNYLMKYFMNYLMKIWFDENIRTTRINQFYLINEIHTFYLIINFNIKKKDGDKIRHKG